MPGINRFYASSVVVYPASNSSIRDYKVNSEQNISSLASRVSRNRVKSGLSLSLNGSNLVLSEGEAIINGYSVTLTGATVISQSVASVATDTSKNNYVFLYLDREELDNEDGSTNTNLLGTTQSTTTSAIFQGLKIGIVSDDNWGFNDVQNPHSVILNFGESAEGTGVIINIDDLLILGYITNRNNTQFNVYNLEESRAYLYPQDIYVYGIDSPSEDIEHIVGDPTCNYLQTSMTLDELLATMIISDGQFN